jgi:hypothetical protein
MSEEEFDAEAELKKYDNTETTVVYWNDPAPNRLFDSLREAAKYLNENPAKGAPAELVAHGSTDRFFKDGELAAVLAAV